MKENITASMLYNYVQCPHRLTMDLCGNPDDRDPISPFIQLLWDKGTAFEREVIESLKLPFENLSVYPADEKEKLTLEAMEQGRELIYGGRIRT